VDDAMAQEVAQLAADGWTQATIAAELGLSKGSVWRALQRDGGTQPAGRDSGARRGDDAEAAAPGLFALIFVAGLLILAGVGWWRRRNGPPEDQPPSPLR